MKTTDLPHIRVRELCPECKGAGTVTDPAWLDFFEWADKFKARGGYVPGLDEEAAWWRGRGCKVPPASETDCPTCEGFKLVERWRPLGELLEPLLAAAIACDQAESAAEAEQAPGLRQAFDELMAPYRDHANQLEARLEALASQYAAESREIEGRLGDACSRLNRLERP